MLVKLELTIKCQCYMNLFIFVILCLTFGMLVKLIKLNNFWNGSKIRTYDVISSIFGMIDLYK